MEKSDTIDATYLYIYVFVYFVRCGGRGGGGQAVAFAFVMMDNTASDSLQYPKHISRTHYYNHCTSIRGNFPFPYTTSKVGFS